MQRPQQPVRPGPAPDAHDRERGDDRSIPLPVPGGALARPSAPSAIPVPCDAGSPRADRPGDRCEGRIEAALGDEEAPAIRVRSCQVETSSLPVIRHQAGRSSATEGSVERISRSCPAASGSIRRRIWSSSPLPQSRSPPSNRVRRLVRVRAWRVPAAPDHSSWKASPIAACRPALVNS